MIVIADKLGSIDSAFHTLVKDVHCDIPIVMVSWDENFVFNDALHSIKEYVLVCFCEYGWDWDLSNSGSHIWGVNSEKFPRYYNGEWVKFDNWVKENPPKMIFKRELLKTDVSDKVKPIDYPCTIPPEPMQSREQFNNRMVNVFQYWGRSNEHRVRIQYQIWEHAYKKGFQPCDNVYFINQYLSEEKSEKWITLWMPHWARIPIEQLMRVNAISKLSISLPGAGFKCFRTGESPANSVMVMQKNNYAFAYDWNDANCILVEPGNEIEGIEVALKRNDLYDIYLNGVENVNNYRTHNYINNYILPIINKA